MEIAKTQVRRALSRFGYTIRRSPPPRFDPRFALEVGFSYVLAHYLACRDDSRPFFFLQAGAFDGVFDDPLHRHVRAGNWHGLLVEPQTYHYNRLVETYAGHSGLRLVNAAIAERPGVRKLYVIQDEAGVTIESLAGVASFRQDALRIPHEKFAVPGSRIGSIDVTCTTFADLLLGIERVDLLQIDVEGYDLELLKLFEFDRRRPPIVHYEHRHLTADESDEAVELLATHGYRMVREEYDTTAYLPPT